MANNMQQCTAYNKLSNSAYSTKHVAVHSIQYIKQSALGTKHMQQYIVYNKLSSSTFCTKCGSTQHMYNILSSNALGTKHAAAYNIQYIK